MPESLKATEEKMIYVCEPETGRGLNDDEDEDQLRISSTQEGRVEIPVFQEGNKLRSLRGLKTVRRTAKEFHIASWAMKEITAGSQRLPRSRSMPGGQR
jgi:hypothetical protein